MVTMFKNEILCLQQQTWWRITSCRVFLRCLHLLSNDKLPCRLPIENQCDRLFTNCTVKSHSCLSCCQLDFISLYDAKTTMTKITNNTAVMCMGSSMLKIKKNFSDLCCSCQWRSLGLSGLATHQGPKWGQKIWEKFQWGKISKPGGKSLK